MTMNERPDETRHTWSVGYKIHGDGLAPAATPFGAVLRLPVELRPMPMSYADDERTIGLGVSFDAPVYVSPLLGQGVVAVEGGPLIHPGEPIRIRVSNSADISARTVVANVLFFSPPDELVRL